MWLLGLSESEALVAMGDGRGGVASILPPSAGGGRGGVLQLIVPVHWDLAEHRAQGPVSVTADIYGIFILKIISKYLPVG